MLQVGAASIVINNELGTDIQGATTRQVVESIRDDLEANALYVQSDQTQVLIINCDVVGLEPHWTKQFRSSIANALGMTADNIVIHCSHTHAGPSVIPTCYGKPTDKAYHERLDGWLVDVAKRAKESAQDAKLRMAQGSLPLGYNRRSCWADGTHDMGAATKNENYTGPEGPTDPTHIAMIAETEEGNPIAVLHACSAHPTMLYGVNFLSAEYPGEARKCIRQTLGDLPVLYINGPFGDISPQDLNQKKRVENEKYMRAMGIELAGATLKLLAYAPIVDSAQLDARSHVLQVPLRTPDPQKVEEGKAIIAKYDAGEEVVPWQLLWGYGSVKLAEMRETSEVEEMSIHAIRLGDLAIVTHPTELYCQFGIDLRRRSPAKMTAIGDCTNGYSGYCPTYSSYLTGGYSGGTIWWTRLAPEAGYRIVDEAARMLHEMWRD